MNISNKVYLSLGSNIGDRESNLAQAITAIEISKAVGANVIATASTDEKLNILFWNGFWNWPFFGMGVGNRGFVSNKCKYQNCFTTNQRKKLINTHSRIDAIVAHGWDEDLSKLATKKVSQDDFINEYVIMLSSN